MNIVVLGAGPAGLAAAGRAHESGSTVTLIDDNTAPGGQIWRGDKAPASSLVPLLTNTRAISADPHHRTILVETPESSREIHFDKLILATGAREIFLPFPGWTLPGIFGVGGLQALAKSGLPIEGQRIVVAGSGPLLLAAAAYFRRHGGRVKLIAEQTSRLALARFALQLARTPRKASQALALQFALAGVPYRQDCWIESAEGDGRLRQVRLRRHDKTWTEDCDFAAVAYGLYPNTELAALLGCRIDGRAIQVDPLQGTTLDGIYAAGECTGIGGVDLSIAEGAIAGYAAAGQNDRARSLWGQRAAARRFADALNTAFTLRESLKGLPRPETFVCRCEDISYARLRTMPSFRAAKLHTRCGMGPCQGRICGPAADFLFGWQTDSIRPPIFPARIASLALESQAQEASHI